MFGALFLSFMYIKLDENKMYVILKPKKVGYELNNIGKIYSQTYIRFKFCEVFILSFD